ncbi:hypothetical protein A3709_19915 [Halioglobus sp. HI00S01]|nr:hypothetical protein A3709_19915 [Halioglobus sp. HI00S01]
MPTEELVAFLTKANAAYRAGSPIMSDHEYDHVYLAELANRDPEHEFLVTVEPESASTAKITHEKPMLSTDKVYIEDDVGVQRFVKRVLSAASALGLSADSVFFRVTPKLDGIAAGLYNGVLATRGDGIRGTDITRLLDAGVQIEGTVTGDFQAGEIVCHQPYFDSVLAEVMEHPRNFVAGIASSDEIGQEGVDALSAGAIRLVLFDDIPAQTVSAETLLSDFGSLYSWAAQAVDYLTDGAVVEALGEGLADHMGSTSHHHNNQIAMKQVGESGSTTVRGIAWQVGRGGRITPVVEVEPIRLSNATISRVTAHHAGNIIASGLGVGAEVTLVRSGEVIPKILGVTRKADVVAVPDTCPCCKSTLTWDGDFLYCRADDCAAARSSAIEHFFKTLGNADGFGPSTCQMLADQEFSLTDIYTATVADFGRAGLGPGQCANLVAEVLRSRTEAVEDWRFLAAFGIRHLGRGDSRRLLEHYSIGELRGITANQIRAIDGFGAVTSESISAELQNRIDEIEKIHGFGFALIETACGSSDSVSEGELNGKGIVFTGKLSLPREEMQAAARALGANVQSSVSGKTDYLVAGEKVGASKLGKAEKLGVTVITEKEYHALAS